MRMGVLSMKVAKRIVVLTLGMLISAACASMTATTGEQTGTGMANASQTQMNRPTATISPTATETPTQTPYPTALPMVTPSPGPAPDLEVINATFNREHAPWNIFLAEIRNNTNEVMIFPESEIGLRIIFKLFYEKDYLDDYYSYELWEANIKPGFGDSRKINCYLFPGETGVVSVDLNSICTDPRGCRMIDEGKSLTPPLGVGHQLVEIDGRYRLWKDFPGKWRFENYPQEFETRLQPKVENLEYEIKYSNESTAGPEFLLSFDVDYFQPKYVTSNYTSVWVMLYDSQGSIINVLYNGNLQYCYGQDCLQNGKYHISGLTCNRGKCPQNVSSESEPLMEIFSPKVVMTDDDLRRVDHIRALFEIQPSEICEMDIRW
jgi:hypothetical protein